MPNRASFSPLAGAALALIGAGATPSDLVDRLAANHAAIDEDVAQAHLEELCDLGLAHAVPDPAGTRYHVTPLGERMLGLFIAADPRQADLLAEIEQMRTDILSTIAHELRTPLTAVRTSVSLLLDPDLEPSAEQRRSRLEAIDRNASRMQRVVGDILDLARFRAGGIHLEQRQFDATELARSAIASVASLAESRGQTIDLAAPPDPLAVFGDVRRLEQALVNLLSNAEKYSPSGSPIQVIVASAPDEVSWSVTDHGPGITPEDQRRLFERFFVASRKRTDATAGIGLGLPITLLIAQAHGGRIDVESRPGHGSTFRLRLPAAARAGAPTE